MMNMREYVADTFLYNDVANKKLLGKIKLLDNKEQCIRYFSHLINSQKKWMARITQDEGYEKMSWWEPVYELHALEEEWNKSLEPWLSFVDKKSEDQLNTEVMFTGSDNSRWAATPMDIALQLNYHSIHHRAQMQSLIRKEGMEPDFLDYIGTKYRKIE